MENTKQVTKSYDNDRDTRKTWMRGLFMLLFFFAFGIGVSLTSLVAAVQFLWLLFSGKPNGNLIKFGQSLSIWIADTTKFLTCVNEEKPFPWSEWQSSTD